MAGPNRLGRFRTNILLLSVYLKRFSAGNPAEALPYPSAASLFPSETAGGTVEVRGRGLIQALQLTIPGRPIAEAGLEKGVLFNVVQGNVMRFLPSFLLEPVHVDRMMTVFRPALEAAEFAQQPILAAAGR